jgi:hypothetical protein
MMQIKNRTAIDVSRVIAVLVFAASPSYGQVGNSLGHVAFSNNCGFLSGVGSGVGIGITFDGTNLWFSCYNSKLATVSATDLTPAPNDLFKADPNTGAVLAAYHIAGGMGAIAYDATRNVIWAGEGDGCNDVTVYGCDNQAKVIQIPLDSNKNASNGVFTVAFPVPAAYCSPPGGCGSQDIVDGLAIDTTTDTLYIHYDFATTFQAYTASTGAFLGPIQEAADIPLGTPLITPQPGANGLCVLSGLAIGGSTLFEGSDYCDYVWAVDKSSLLEDLASSFSIASTVSGASFSGSGFDEKTLTCDPRTFFPSLGDHALWVKEPFDPQTAYAFDIPLNSCGIGGQPAPTTTPTCPLTKGFWKNHGAQWPVTSLTLGLLTYTESQLLTILTTSPQGDVSISLADQLIATKLDLANGSDPTPISAAVVAADTELTAVGPIPASIKGSTTAGQAMTATATILSSYNNDQLTPTCTAFIPTGPANH